MKMITENNISLEPLTRLAPTTWLRLRRCAWQYLLGRSKVVPLPSHPNLWLGIVVHEAIEQIERDQFSNIEEFNNWWTRRIDSLAVEMIAKGAAQFLPLNDYCMQYGFKKAQVRMWLEDRLKQLETNVLQRHSNKETANYPPIFSQEKIFEKELISTNGLLIGKPDRINRRQDWVEILDYKTGEIFENSVQYDEHTEGVKNRTIKEDYTIQLKIYAQLYADKYGIYPNRLALVDMTNKAHEIPFTAAECQDLIEQATLELSIFNTALTTNKTDDLPKFGKSCSTCLYKPHCKVYLQQLDANDGILNLEETINRFDISGNFVSFTKMDNGNGIIHLQTKNAVVVIRQVLVAIVTPFFKDQKLIFYNLKQTTEKTFDFTNFSKIYAT